MKLFRNIVFCAVLILSACTKQEQEQDPGTVEPEKPLGNPSVEVPEIIDVVQEGISGTYPVTVRDAEGWEPCVEKTGFISHAEFDAANSVVKYDIGPNNTTEELRSSIKFILKSPGQNDVVAITSFLQAGKPGASGYKKVTSTPSDWAGTYLLVATSGNYSYAANGKVSGNWLEKTDVEVENNVIQITEATETVEAVISKLGDNYTIKFEDGYLGSENDNKGIKIESSASDSEFFWNFSISSEAITIFLPKVSNRILCYNGSGFRTYTSVQGVKCSLYKKEGSAPTPIPVVTTGEVSDITKTSATLHGSCENMSAVICSFYYGTSKTNLSQKVQAPAAGKTFSASVSGLAAGTKYYFQAEVQTGTGTFSGAVGEFTTAEEGGGGGGGGTGLADYGWYELPAQTDKDRNGIDDNNPDYYYSHTFRADASSIRNFSCCYSKSKIHPVWVAAPFHKCYKGSSGRNDSYKDDPNIHCTQAAKWSGYTRGHMVGSSDRTVSVPTNRQAFYHSNIGAQLSTGFNTGGGRWNKLEEFVDGKWCSDTLYMVNGCIFEEWGGVSPKTVAGSSIPTAYYKAMLRTKKGNTGKSLKNCTEDEIMCVAFIIAHKSYATNIEPTSADMYSITELEALTGLTFFVNVPQAPKLTYKASDWGL